MEIKLLNNQLLKSLDEEEFLSFGGPWQASFCLDNIQLPGRYLLEDDIVTDDKFCALIEVEVLGKWRSDVRFSVVIIDLTSKRVLKSKRNFSALSTLKISGGTVFFAEDFNIKETKSPKHLEINDDNFIQLIRI